MALNREDGGNRKYICVQLPEPCDKDSEAFKAGYKTIADIAKERIRRAGKKIKEEIAAEKKAKKGKLDFGEGGESKEDIDKLLLDILPGVLDEKQRKNKIRNLVYAMSKRDKSIKNQGTNRYPKWVKVR